MLSHTGRPGINNKCHEINTFDQTHNHVVRSYGKNFNHATEAMGSEPNFVVASGHVTDAERRLPTDGQPSFSPAATRAVLETACRVAGLRMDDAELIRTGENALYNLPVERVIVRIARTLDYWSQAEKEVGISAWLLDVGFPAARTVDNINQPVEILGHPVTFWHYIDGRDADINDMAMFALQLKQFHSLPKPDNYRLPSYVYDDRVIRRLESVQDVREDREYLLGRFKELQQEVEKLSYHFPASPVHGDAHTNNMRIDSGVGVLLDFEVAGWGQREWDLSVTATEYATAGFLPDKHYAQFVDSYGFDVMTWSGFDVVRQVQEIKMTTWLMQNVGQSADIAEEFNNRMKTIRGGGGSRKWRPY